MHKNKFKNKNKKIDINYTLYYYSVLSSTNDKAKTWIKEKNLNQKIVDPIVFTSLMQTQGRGSKDRKWYSRPNGGLYYTLILSINQFNTHKAAYYTHQTALSIIKVIKQETNITCEPEWPNDIILNRKKCGGILIETVSNPMKSHARYAIIGIGLNINQIKFPIELTHSATSLKYETGQHYNNDIIMNELSKELINVFTRN